MLEIPYTSYSWTIYDTDLASKIIDKSLLNNHETGIPKEIFKFFWPKLSLRPGEKFHIQSFSDPKAKMYLEQTNHGRYRLKGISTKNHWQIGQQLLIEVRFSGEINIYSDNETNPNNHDQQLKTEATSQVKIRLKQAKFRDNVIKVTNGKCAVTEITDLRLLIASHIIPWADATDQQRVDGHNGLLLSPHLDKLFDSHLISFNEDGELVVSEKLDNSILKTWGIDILKRYQFTEQQHNYLKVHCSKLKMNELL
jgi:hypothetical protein